ncbi:MAG TPA: ABC transporter permease [Thermomicrobiaceae bacterium]|nr:ABC transporter permease [Thermomicrobiaceae bacterium]
MHLLLTKNVRDVQRRPLRTVLTMIGVILGVAGVVAISFAGRNLAAAEQDTYASTRQPDITAYVSAAPANILSLLSQRPGIVAVDSRAIQITRATTGSGWVNTRLVGVDDFSNMPLDTVQLVSGHYPGPGEIAFDASARKLTSIRIGDLVALQATANQPITYAHVSGFVRAPATIDASILDEATAFMPAHDVRVLLGSSSNNYLMIRVADPARASQIATTVKQLLSERGIATGSMTVKSPTNFTGSAELATLLLLLQVFSVVGAILSSFLVANTVAAIMVEETRQIGLIKALGGSRWQAMQPYLTFALMLGVTGSVLGWVAGLGGGELLTRYLAGLSGLTLPPFTLAPREFLLALGVGVAVTLTSSLLPAWSATRQRVSRLLANVGVVADFNRGITQWLTARVSRAGALVTMGLRNVTRRPVRAAITLTVVAVAVAAFVSTQAVNRSVSITVNHLYALYDAQGFVLFGQPMGLDFGSVLDQTPGVIAAEPWGNVTGSIGSTQSDVWGMPANTSIYTPRLVAGTWLTQSNPIAAVLTTNVAQAVGASVGDVTTLDIGTHSTLVTVVGIVNDASTYLGATTTGKVFLQISDLQRIVGLSGTATLFALKLQATAPAAVDQELNAVEARFRQYAPVTLPMYQDQESSRRAIDILTVMLDAMVTIVSLVGLAGIVNTLLINLTERRREYGVLRALGASGWQLMRLVLTEALGLTVLGFALGILIGYPLARWLVAITGEQLFQLEFHLGALTVLLTFVVALAATAAVSTVPGLVAGRLRPIQVLRYE